MCDAGCSYVSVFAEMHVAELQETTYTLITKPRKEEGNLLHKEM